MKRSYFGTDGIRGQSNVFPMTPDLAMRVGIAVGTIFRRGNHRHRGSSARIPGFQVMLETPWWQAFAAAGPCIRSRLPTPLRMLTRVVRADMDDLPAHNHMKTMVSSCSARMATNRRTRSEIEKLERTSTCSWQSPMISAAPNARWRRDRYIEHAKRTLPRDVTLQAEDRHRLCPVRSGCACRAEQR